MLERWSPKRPVVGAVEEITLNVWVVRSACSDCRAFGEAILKSLSMFKAWPKLEKETRIIVNPGERRFWQQHSDNTAGIDNFVSQEREQYTRSISCVCSILLYWHS